MRLIILFSECNKYTTARIFWNNNVVHKFLFIVDFVQYAQDQNF